MWSRAQILRIADRVREKEKCNENTLKMKWITKRKKNEENSIVFHIVAIAQSPNTIRITCSHCAFCYCWCFWIDRSPSLPIVGAIFFFSFSFHISPHHFLYVWITTKISPSFLHRLTQMHTRIWKWKTFLLRDRCAHQPKKKRNTPLPSINLYSNEFEWIVLIKHFWFDRWTRFKTYGLSKLNRVSVKIRIKSKLALGICCKMCFTAQISGKLTSIDRFLSVILCFFIRICIWIK